MSYPVNDAKTVYIRVPNNPEKKTVEISLTVPADKDVYLKVDLLDKSATTDIPVKNNCMPSHCRICQVHYCPVYQEQAELYELSSHIKEEHVQKADDGDTIPGHPNCKRGECADCHVVSCPIYLGYEEEP